MNGRIAVVIRKMAGQVDGCEPSLGEDAGDVTFSMVACASTCRLGMEVKSSMCHMLHLQHVSRPKIGVGV